MANNIIKANINVEGTRTLIWNRFSEDRLDAKTKKSGTKGNDPNEWKKTVLLTKDNQLYIMPESIFSCIKEGGKYTKNGRGTMQNIVTATLQIIDNIILTNRFLPDELTRDPTEDVYLDVRSVRNPTTRGRNMRYRVATKPEWKMDFTIMWDCSLISEELIESIIIDAGDYCGLGDGRNIGMGRFTLNKFEIISEDAKNAKKTTA
ncbi:hypothetical protein G9F71_016160 [Clostridium sp. FP2]|uniref:hypothetical protein n=1 Tax=Clostridium sp. FP2 TaxID=2724481 RepID=UPI0013E90522|nr:hypothetical protein [Clostridium sp. FP2]MBZ9624387.1 hypothetical protein [Clostridium sp. FP2]